MCHDDHQEGSRLRHPVDMRNVEPKIHIMHFNDTLVCRLDSSLWGWAAGIHPSCNDCILKSIRDDYKHCISGWGWDNNICEFATRQTAKSGCMWYLLESQQDGLNHWDMIGSVSWFDDAMRPHTSLETSSKVLWMFLTPYRTDEPI
jgi:hypothetical protein